MLSLAVTSGCHHGLCVDAGIDPHGKYRATIAGLYDASSMFTYDPSNRYSGDRPSCASADGLGAGVTLEFQNVGTVEPGNETCGLIVADLLSAPAEVMAGDGSATTEEQIAAAQVVYNGLIHTSQQATVGGCAGGYATMVATGNQPLSRLFDPPMTGQLPPALLYRIFVPVAGSSCQACEDNFVIQFEKE